MKIIQINTADITGGSARAAYRLHKGLNLLGESSKMFVLRKSSSDTDVYSVVPSNGLSTRWVKSKFFFYDCVYNLYIDSNRTQLSNTIFSFPYPGYDLSSVSMIQTSDIINLHWISRYQSSVTLKKLFSIGIPVVWTFHDQWAFTGGCHYSAGCNKYKTECLDCPQLTDNSHNIPPAILKDKLELFAGANLTIVTPSRWMAKSAKESRLFRKSRVEAIPNSLETDVFIPISKAEAKKSVGILPECQVILFGPENGEEKRKGFQELIQAMRFCLRNPEFQNLVSNDKVKILCFGYPNDELSTLGISLVSLGYVKADKTLTEAYSAADVFVLPSIQDNLPNTMLESMSCGTPVVAFDIGGMPDLIVDGVTGRLVPSGDISGMGQAILDVLFNTEQSRLMGKKCRQVIKEGYSLTTQAERYLELYQELVKKNKTSYKKNLQVSTAAFEPRMGQYFQNVHTQIYWKALKEAPKRLFLYILNFFS